MNGTATIAVAGPYPCTSLMAATLIGYARCSTDRQDLDTRDHIYTDHGLTATTRARPGLDQALAAVCAGDTLVVPKLDRLARFVPDARAIAGQLQERSVKLALGRTLYDPDDPMGNRWCMDDRYRSALGPAAHSPTPLNGGVASDPRLTARNRRANLRLLTIEHPNQRLLVARRSNLSPTPVGIQSESAGQKEIR